MMRELQEVTKAYVCLNFDLRQTIFWLGKKESLLLVKGFQAPPVDTNCYS